MVVPGVHLLSDTLIMPHTYHASGDSTAVCLINASDKDVVLAAESLVDRAVEADLHDLDFAPGPGPHDTGWRVRL